VSGVCVWCVCMGVMECVVYECVFVRCMCVWSVVLLCSFHLLNGGTRLEQLNFLTSDLYFWSHHYVIRNLHWHCLFRRLVLFFPCTLT